MLWEWAEDAELSEGAVTAEPSTAGRSPVPLLDQALSSPHSFLGYQPRAALVRCDHNQRLSRWLLWRISSHWPNCTSATSSLRHSAVYYLRKNWLIVQLLRPFLLVQAVQEYSEIPSWVIPQAKSWHMDTNFTIQAAPWIVTLTCSPLSRWVEKFLHARKDVDRLLLSESTNSHSVIAVSSFHAIVSKPQSSPSALPPHQPYHL